MKRVIIPCDFCEQKACGVWGNHLYCVDCFQKREPPDTTVEEFEKGIEDLLTSQPKIPR